MNPIDLYDYYDKHFKDKKMSFDDLFEPLYRKECFVKCLSYQDYDHLALILRHFGYSFYKENNRVYDHPIVYIDYKLKQYCLVDEIGSYTSHSRPRFRYYDLIKYFDYLSLNDDDLALTHTDKLDCKSDEELNEQITNLVILGADVPIQVEFDFTNKYVIESFDKCFNQKLDYEERIFINKYQKKSGGTKAIYMHAACKVLYYDFREWATRPEISLMVSNITPSKLKNDIEQYYLYLLNNGFKGKIY